MKSQKNLFQAYKSGEDPRGTFTKLTAEGKLADGTSLGTFCEELVTVSLPGVLRGLHFQYRPVQAKWVQCLSGRVWDVVVDLRKDSATYRKLEVMELSYRGPLLKIPIGFAHGFCVLGNEPATLLYRFQEPYDPKGESSIRWDDPVLNIPWPITKPLLSDRDRAAPGFADYDESDINRIPWWKKENE